MVALTDVRLVLGERLGLRTDEDAEALAPSGSTEADAGRPGRGYWRRYYDFLTWLQESLTQALMG